MASLVVLALVVAVVGMVSGAFLKICLAIRREDRSGTLRWDAPNRSAQSARELVGFTRRA